MERFTHTHRHTHENVVRSSKHDHYPYRNFTGRATERQPELTQLDVRIHADNGEDRVRTKEVRHGQHNGENHFDTYRYYTAAQAEAIGHAYLEAASIARRSDRPHTWHEVATIKQLDGADSVTVS